MDILFSPAARGGLVFGGIKPANWSGYSTLVLDVHNPGKKEVIVGVTIRSVPGSWKDHEAAHFSGPLQPGVRVRWRMPILWARYGFRWGWPSGWPPQEGMEHSSGWGWVDTRRIREVSVFPEQVERQVRLRLISLALEGPVRQKGWCDRYGQQTGVSWPGKMRCDADLKKADRRERGELARHRGNPVRDIYQAWEGGPRRRATGFFRVEQVDGRWWFVAPNGNLFYACGIDAVRCGPETVMDGVRRSAYSWLPPRRGRFAEAWIRNPVGGVETDCVSFYRVNLVRKWGAERFRENFYERAIDRHLDWGFTCIGNWSDPVLLARRRFPYFQPGPPMGKVRVPLVTELIHDAFHPDFERETRRIAGDSVSGHRGDPWLVGHFLGNELDWNKFAAGVLGLPAGRPARCILVHQLRERYGCIKALNRAWGTSAASFSRLRWPGEAGAGATGAAKRDMAVFRGRFAERWYRAWASAVRKADPNHLVLGSRLHSYGRPDEVIAACARHSDVVSFNNYDIEVWKEEFGRYQKIARKPFLIGEYGHNSMDSGQLGAAIPVASQAERGLNYRYYTEQAAALPYFVGTQYFQYFDEPVTGRWLDNETEYNGFVSVADIPYPPMVEAARDSHRRIYRVHSGEVKPFCSWKPAPARRYFVSKGESICGEWTQIYRPGSLVIPRQPV